MTYFLGLLKRHKVIIILIIIAAAIVASSQPLYFYLGILLNNINFYTASSKKPKLFSIM